MAASREHQGLVLSLIIFVTLTVMMSVTSYVLYSRDEAAVAKLVAAENKAQEQLNLADNIQGKLNATKKMLGLSEAAPHEAIEVQLPLIDVRTLSRKGGQAAHGTPL